MASVAIFLDANAKAPYSFGELRTNARDSRFAGFGEPTRKIAPKNGARELLCAPQ